MDKFSVTGMSCAACSAHVEKAVLEVPGVTSVAVSLLTNSMNVEGTAAPSDVIHGTYDVELAIAVLSGRQSCGNGIVSDASDYSGHGHQSKIFYQWLYKFAA